MTKSRTPFLLRFAQKCLSPGRHQQNINYKYDKEKDMVLWLGHEAHPLAIDQAGEDGPMTKKCDLEKGDDTKDRRMWQ